MLSTDEIQDAIRLFAGCLRNSSKPDKAWRVALELAQAELARREPDAVKICDCSHEGPICNEHRPADTSEILPRCECGHARDCHKEEA